MSGKSNKRKLELTKRGKKNVIEDDDEDYNEEVNNIEEIDLDLEEEIALPEVLKNISNNEKKELLEYKHNHTERDWEVEMLRRSDLMMKKIDLERLKQMTQATTTNKSSKRNIVPVIDIEKDDEDDDDDDDNIINEIEEEIEDDEESIRNDDSDDDLFDSDEEEMMSSKFKKTYKNTSMDDDDDDDDEVSKKSKRIKQATTKKSTKNKKVTKSRLDSMDDDDSYGENESQNSDFDGIRDEEEMEDNRYKKREDDDSPPAELSDYQRVQVRRILLEMWCKEPWFDKAVIGSFVRFFIGKLDGDKTDKSVQVYRMCEISGVNRTSKPYRLADSGITTNIRLELSIGTSMTKVVKIDQISNSRVQEHELKMYLELSSDDIITKKEIERIRSNQHKALRHTYSHNEITNMAKSNPNARIVTVGPTTALDSLHKKRTIARKEGNYEVLEQTEKQIEIIEQQIEKEKEIHKRAAEKQIEVNRRNKESNYKRDNELAARRKAQQAEAEAKGISLFASLDDPFIRRETRPVALWMTGSKLNNEKQKEKNKQEIEEITKKIKYLQSINQNDHNLIDLQEKLKLLESKKLLIAEKCKKKRENPNVKDKDKNINQINKNFLISKEIIDNKEDNINFSLDAIRKQVKVRLGVDPFEAANEDPRDIYLRKTCSNLPLINSSERDTVRQGMSLNKWFQIVNSQREEVV